MYCINNRTEEDTHWDVRHNITAKGFQPPSSSDTPGFRSVSAPITKPGHVPSGPPKIALCWMCSQQVTGLFVIVKGIIVPVTKADELLTSYSFLRSSYMHQMFQMQPMLW